MTHSAEGQVGMCSRINSVDMVQRNGAISHYLVSKIAKPLFSLHWADVNLQTSGDTPLYVYSKGGKRLHNYSIPAKRQLEFCCGYKSQY